MSFWILREPAFRFGLPVYVCAALLFPLYLGSTGAPLISLVGYLFIAAVLFSVADAALDPRFYLSGLAILPQSALSLLGLLLPAGLAFLLGSAIAPSNERVDEDDCLIEAVAETQTLAAAEAGSFDLMVECRT